jgi:hypothetical protein
MTRVRLRPKQGKKLNNMKTKISSKLLLILGLVFVLGSAITQVRGQGVVTIQSTGDVTRGQTGSFVLNMNIPPYFWAAAVNFSVSGTAIPGVDYVPLVSPVLVLRAACPPPAEHCWPRGLGVIQVQTLPDLRASFFRQAYSVVVTLKPGVGYTIGEPSSAQIVINPWTSNLSGRR